MRREATRSLLARMIVAVAALLACTVVALAILQRPLGVGSDALALAERTFLAMLGLALLVSRFYFPGR